MKICKGQIGFHATTLVVFLIGESAGTSFPSQTTKGLADWKSWDRTVDDVWIIDGEHRPYEGDASVQGHTDR